MCNRRGSASANGYAVRLAGLLCGRIARQVAKLDARFGLII